MVNLQNIDDFLSALPLDGYKSAIGMLLQFVSPFVPGLEPVLLTIGQLITLLGLVHKGIKEQREIEITVIEHNEKGPVQ
jgi:hypothetical protein